VLCEERSQALRERKRAGARARPQRDLPIGGDDLDRGDAPTAEVARFGADTNLSQCAMECILGAGFRHQKLVRLEKAALS
jgi:hypothetical protein